MKLTYFCSLAQREAKIMPLVIVGRDLLNFRKVGFTFASRSIRVPQNEKIKKKNQRLVTRSLKKRKVKGVPVEIKSPCFS